MSEPAYTKPLPQPDLDTRPYWDWAKRHELRILRCRACGFYIHFPQPACPRCWSEDTDWERVSGRGTVYSFIVVHHPAIPSFADSVPYVVAVVELDEQPGLRIPTNLVDCPPDRVRVDLPVTVVFEDVTPEVTLPKFKPV